MKLREPAERGETVRQAIVRVLRGRWLSAREISKEVRISEREVGPHLEHVARSAAESGAELGIEPARCLGCGHEFEPGVRRPSRCPECKAERISAPKFRIEP
jgi:predicted Zn-ribbon and HTH transcriptional regulator